jgi:hypothetical protein
MSHDPTLLARFWAKVDKDGPTPEHRPDLAACWLWTAARQRKDRDSYGVIGVTAGGRYRMHLAHRVSYELHVGTIPQGLQLDHLCRVRRCVNPEHLEPVTNRENSLRGLKGRMVTHCPQGHEYTDANTYWAKVGTRSCRTCNRERQRARYWSSRAAA